MAAVEITISGILYDKLNRTQQHVVLIGDASLTGLGIGGGPVYPPGGGGPPGFPAHPIWWPPIPSHPIVLPDPPPVEPPTEPPTNPPNVQWVWGYSPALGGWTPVYIPPEGAAGPKA